jgi:hypothetical protein
VIEGEIVEVDVFGAGRAFEGAAEVVGGGVVGLVGFFAIGELANEALGDKETNGTCGFVPMRSIMREKAAAVEFAWKEERTRWPVIEAWIAVRAVSASRISPTMTTSGSRRRTERRPSAKEPPSFV